MSNTCSTSLDFKRGRLTQMWIQREHAGSICMQSHSRGADEQSTWMKKRICCVKNELNSICTFCQCSHLNSPWPISAGPSWSCAKVFVRHRGSVICRLLRVMIQRRREVETRQWAYSNASCPCNLGGMYTQRSRHIVRSNITTHTHTHFISTVCIISLWIFQRH